MLASIRTLPPSGVRDRHVSENHLALGIDQLDKIQAADILRQAQLPRPAQIALTVADALGRLIDNNSAGLVHVGARDLLKMNANAAAVATEIVTEKQREAKSP